jgi:hypothetical protein
MLARCGNPNHKHYRRYGGRGIKVCKRWQRSFVLFLRDMGKPPTGRHQLDRIDNDGDYKPSNCRWVTNKQNAQNKRNNRHITHDGETLTLQQWADRTGIARYNIAGRLKAGWSVHDALTLPLMTHAEAGRLATYPRV